MKLIFAIFVSLYSTLSICCPNIIGEWKSDAKLSNDFNDTYAEIPDNVRSFLTQIYGKSTLNVKKSEMSLSSTVTKITIDEKTHDWNGSYEVTYEMLGCSESAVSLRVYSQDLTWLAIYQFVDDDTFWLYNAHYMDSGNNHTREYFKRVKP